MIRKIISKIRSLFTNRNLLYYQGIAVHVRNNGVDHEVFDYVFHQKYHRPHLLLKNSSPVILDLGVNIGFSVIDLKTQYPAATIIGYELDGDNYKMALQNTSTFSDIHIINRGIWFENARLNYDRKSNADAYKLESSQSGENFAGSDTITIGQVIRDFDLKVIDYVKMDIEGAEKQIFEHDLSWLAIVKQLKIEVHYGEDIFNFIRTKLNDNGFVTLKDTHHWSTIIAYRE